MSGTPRSPEEGEYPMLDSSRPLPLAHLRSLPSGSLHATEVMVLCDEIERLTLLLGAKATEVEAIWIEENDRIKALAVTVLDNLGEDCELDHAGYCQAHFVERPCSVAALAEVARA